jgi:hypothetical protein
LNKNTLIGISGSYDFDAYAAFNAANKYQNDIDSGNVLRTIPIFRGMIDGIHNLKFCYPVNSIPIIVRTALRGLELTDNVRITGDDEEKIDIEILNDEIGSKVEFVHEGYDEDELKISNSLDNLFGDSKYKHNYFVTGDIPFARNYINPNYNSDIIADLNSRELLKKCMYIKRNFYNKAKYKGKIHYFKEPNIYYFSDNAIAFMKEISETLFNNRKNGGLAIAAWEYLTEKIINELSDSKGMYKALAAKKVIKNMGSLGLEYLKLKWQKSHLDSAFALDFKRCNRSLSSFFDLDVNICFMHKDIFRMLDIDGLNNDWTLYEGVASKLESKYDFPVIKRLQRAFEANKKDLPVFNNFEELIERYIKDINEHLEKKNKIKFNSLDSFKQEHTYFKAVDELVKQIELQGISKMSHQINRFKSAIKAKGQKIKENLSVPGKIIPIN